MAEEERNEEQQEETPEQASAEDAQPEQTEAAEAPAEEAPAEEAPAEEAPAEDASAEEEAPAEEAPAEDDAPAEQAPAEQAEEPAAEGGDDELEGLDWKARRRLLRSREAADQRPQQSPDERAAARREARQQAAGRRSSYRAKRRGKQEPGTGTPPAERRSAGRKTRQGRVISSKPDKTITVAIEVARRHPQYEKIVRRSRTLHAHDARNEAGEGDLVRLVETRPMSRTKRWRLVEILEKAR
jgi:small subunit ribosomal protein S17